MSSFVKIESISKKYNDTLALDAISFEVEKGKLFGLIGPDGAGKTSLIRILATLLLPNQGRAEINGLDVVKDYKKLRKQIGYMPGSFSLYHDLTVEENLTFFATIFNTTIKENYHLIKDIYQQIEPFKNRRAGNLSGGMKQKLALSCALIHKPEILFLDEPTTGIDAVSRVELWDMLKKLREQNLTIIVSTPYMNEAELCDEVALIQQGRILEIDTPQNIIDNYDKPLFAVSGDDYYQLLLKLRKLSITQSAYSFGESIHLTTKENIEAESLRDLLSSELNEQLSVEKIKANIEDCFIGKMSEQ